jgi:leucyl aminopeptidase
MTVATLHTTSATASTVSADVLVVGVSASDDGPVLHVEGDEFDALREALSAIGFTGAKDAVRRLPAIGAASSIALVGLGSKEIDGTFSVDALRYAAGTAARQLVGVESIVLALPVSDSAGTLAVLEGAAIGAYSFTSYRHSTLDATKLPATTITVVSAFADEALVEHALAVAHATHTVRDLVNIPASDLFPESFAERVIELAAGLPVSVEVLADAELEAGGYGGIIGIGKGSSRGPRLVKVSYGPEGAGSHIALVGKGITFDTGGLSLKPPASMVGMKYDMTGAATVLAVVLAAARLGVATRVTAWLCLAENMPSGTAIRPNDVVTIRGGTTVEVLNTDAEGRVVLADGIAAASEEFPDAIIDVATLTGAQRVALGDRYSGVMGDDDLVRRVIDAAKRSGENLWAMPLPGELRATLNSDVADIANAKIGNPAAGMLLAGVFLQEFVGDRQDGGGRIPWAHIDIAGPANNTGAPFGFTGKGPTAVTVRSLLTLTGDNSSR